MRDRNLMKSGHRELADKLDLKKECKLLLLIYMLSLSVKNAIISIMCYFYCPRNLCLDKYIICFRIPFFYVDYHLETLCFFLIASYWPALSSTMELP